MTDDPVENASRAGYPEKATSDGPSAGVGQGSANAGVRPRRDWELISTGLAIVVGYGLLILAAVDYQSRLDRAPKTPGTVLSIRPGPSGELPAAYRVAYRTPDGKRFVAELGADEFHRYYAVGEQVDLKVLTGEPHAPRGPASLRLAGALRFLPWGIALLPIVFGLRLLAAYLPGLIRGAVVRFRDALAQERPEGRSLRGKYD